MSFVYAGIKVRKNLPAAIRDLFVVDEHNKTDPATGRVNVYRRITYYDSDLGYNVYVASKKIGEIGDDGKIIPILRKKSPHRKEVPDSMGAIADKATDSLSDKRQQAKVIYPMPLVMDIALMAAMSGVTGSSGVAIYWKTNFDVLKQKWGFDMPDQIPTKQTINRLLQLIEPAELQKLYQELVFPFMPHAVHPKESKPIVAVDGQVVRASRNDQDRQHQFLSFYCTDTGIAFYQKLIDSKSNEKPAALELAQRLDLRGTIVTADAMHCDRKLVRVLMENARADYCLAVKMNQSKTAEAIETAFNSDNEAKCGTVKDKDHGREEVKTTYVLPGKLLPASILKKWYGLEFGSIVKQVSERAIVKTGEKSVQTRYYISSLCPESDTIVENIQRAVRGHWGIENKLHHVLDVDFYQDATNAKNANYVCNISQINKFALAVLEVVRRRLAKDHGMKALMPIKTMNLSLQNKPELATEYLDIFVRESVAAACDQSPEPLTV